jgi:hypothetical protein
MDNSLLVVVIVVIVIGLMLGYITTHGTKSQWIRLIDIFAIGPLMIYIGYYVLSYSSRTQTAITQPVIIGGIKLIDVCAVAIIFFGATTITYNLRNYLFEKNSGLI